MDTVLLAGASGDLGARIARALVARGVALEERLPRRLLVRDDAVVGIELADGTALPGDAVFLLPTPAPHDALLAQGAAPGP